jgi:hypothetical protein
MAETMLSLGRLTRVEPRDVWGSEAGHFTPWLAQEDNLRLLGDTSAWSSNSKPKSRMSALFAPISSAEMWLRVHGCSSRTSSSAPTTCISASS